MPGELFIVATPIGNLGDITVRAMETLKTCARIACEDTRRSQKILHHLNLKKPMMRYDEHTHLRSSQEIIQALKRGESVALLTDAGTPSISDPGHRLVADVLKAGHRVIPIPGPSAPIAALSVSGFSADRFVFLGFLPRKEGPAKRLLQEAFQLGRTVVLMESPYRVLTTLQWVKGLRENAHVLVAREMTKLHEEYVRGPVDWVGKQLEMKPLLGEVVIVIGPQE